MSEPKVKLSGRMVAVDLDKGLIVFHCAVHSAVGKAIAPYLMAGEVFTVATDEPVPALTKGETR